jgi:acid phosphatase type 7
VLNSECHEVGGCGPGSPQYQWLQSTLSGTTHTNNILAYWHSPRFTSGTRGANTQVGPFWDLLYAHGADVILVSHDHFYERFAPQDPTGALDTQHGIRQITVGTGAAACTTSARPPRTARCATTRPTASSR